MSQIVRHVIVRGLVQGVGYRAFVADEAQERRLTGWVRNRRDGTVESVFSGPAETVEPIIEACRKGPWGSQVQGVTVRDGTQDELALRHPGEDFSVLPTV